MAWSQGQAKLFAKQILQSGEGRAWWSFVDDIREAILDSKVMSIVLGQDDTRGALAIKNIRDLRTEIAVAMMTVGLETPTGEAIRARRTADQGNG